MQEVGRAAIAASLYASNIYFAWWLRDYFAGPSEFQPLLHTWSLGVEEQFYIFWPVLLWLIAKLAQRWKWQFFPVALTTVVAIMAMSFVAGMLLRLARPELVFFGTPFRAWELGFGACLALYPFGKRVIRPALANAMALVGVAAIAASTAWVGPGELFPAPLALFPAAGTALIILAYCFGPGLSLDRVLAAPSFQWLGRVSYAWYLWHFPLLAIAKLRFLEADLLRDIAIGLVSLLLADATVRLVEKPLRFRILPKIRSGTVVAGGVICGLAVRGRCSVGAMGRAIATARPRS